MKKILYALILPLAVSCTASKKTGAPAIPAALPLIDSITRQFAPDQRVVLFNVQVRGNTLAGETTSAAAKAALLNRLTATGIPFTDSITVLPQASLGAKTKAVVTNSVANLRVQPRHQAELSNQATMGTPLTIWKKERGWYLVQTPDNYLAWVDGGAIEWMDTISFNQWQQAKKLLYAQPYGFAYSQPDNSSATVSDLVYGDIMEVKNDSGDFFEVRFPDGRMAFVAAKEIVPYRVWAETRNPAIENLVATAKNLLGLPYLWGGTSFKGVDCSGFTRTVYFMNGLVLPRDASQQAYVGELVDTRNGWQQLRPGDLLFFGAPAREGRAPRVVHVGMWLGGNDEFIHSSGRVMIGSMNPSAANYDEGEHRRFLWARRIQPGDAVVDLRTASLFEKQ